MATRGKTINIRVAGVPWKVEFKTSWHEVDPTSGERLFGVTMFNEHTIRIAGDAPPEKQHTTLMHEIFHAITHEYGITPFEKEPGVHDEKHIDLMAIATCEVLDSLGMTLPHIIIRGGK